jgi:adenosylcobinamide kinase/adenosylcobinamide-phosphate guanylyltransferase
MEGESMITFISGGSRSGKSEVAERLALQQYIEQDTKENINHSTKKSVDQYTLASLDQSTKEKMTQVSKRKRLLYIATSQILDQEMEERVSRHIQTRGEEWETREEAYDITAILQEYKAGDVILIDCLTIWLSNMLFRKNVDITRIEDCVEEWMEVASKQELHLFIVSNDINEGIPSSYETVLVYMKLLERLHQKIVFEADQAIQVVAGIPYDWKSDADDKTN